MLGIRIGGPMDWKENGAMLFGMKGCPVIDNFHGHIYFFLDITRAPYHDFVCIGSKHLVVIEDILIFVVRIVTIYIRLIYMIVFERIFLYLFGERWSSSWKCSRRVLRSFSSGVYRVSLKEDVNVRLRSVSWKFQRFL